MSSAVGSSSSSPGASLLPPVLPGCSRSELAAITVSLRAREAPPAAEDFTGTFATQEYLQATIKYDPSAVDRIITLPPSHDLSVWLYESLRQVLLELSLFVSEMGTRCDATTCPKMCATENWAFLCAAHPPDAPGKKVAPKECCAIDWCVHTLTGFTVLLNSADEFPNRYTISPKSARHFGDMSRRLYRVFAHAFYHHREWFDDIESRTHLTRRFIAFCLHFELMAPAQMVPPIEGLQAPAAAAAE